LTWRDKFLNEVVCGHALDLLPEIPDGVFHCVVTSPPYWNLRDYKAPAVVWGGEPGCEHEWGAEIPRSQEGGGNRGVPAEWQRPGRGAHTGGTSGQFCGRCGGWKGQLGLEPTPELYVQHIVAVCREVKRVLRDDGVLWLNLGDSYAGSGKAQGQKPESMNLGKMQSERSYDPTFWTPIPPGLKPKDLVGIPWTVAFALRDDGWYLRRDVIWEKPNPMPESCRDRPTSAHEYVFLLTKKSRYYYDADAVREEAEDRPFSNLKDKPILSYPGQPQSYSSGRSGFGHNPAGRNLRSVWNIATAPFSGAHFATFPPELARRCILTSPTKVCKVCGAGWERVTEKRTGTPTTLKERLPKIEHTRRYIGMEGPKSYNCIIHVDAPEIKTLGFRPTCGCDAGADKAIILDPFMGSGTVALVAHENFRHYVGLEINPDYIPLSDKRGLRQEVIF